MSKTSNRARKRRPATPAGSAVALCELLRRQLPLPPSNTASAAVVQFSVNLSLARFPLFHRIQTSKWAAKLIAARQALDTQHSELCALAPVDPLKPSVDEEEQKQRLLQKVDQAICEYVAVDKTGLYEHPLVKARIALAQGFTDRTFFTNLAGAVRRKVGEHRRIPQLVLSRAATMREKGKSWQDIDEAFTRLWASDPDTISPRDKELHEALVEAWGKKPCQPEAFYKRLKRHGLIRRGGQKIKN